MNLNAELKINNMIITDDIEKLNFENIKKGQQIIVFNPVNYYDDYNDVEIKYNNFNIYLSKGFAIKNVYDFDKIKMEISIYGQDEETFEMDSNVNDCSVSYLKIKDDLLELDCIDSVCDISDMQNTEEDCYYSFKELYKRMVSYGFEKGKYSRIVDCEICNKNEINDMYTSSDTNEYEYEFKDYFLIDLEGSLMGIAIKQNIIPSRYSWNKNIEYYLFDQSFEHYTTMEIDKDKLSKLINIIDNNYWDYYRETCSKHLKAHILSLKDIRLENNNRALLINTLNNNSLYGAYATEIVDKFTNPFYIDEQLNIKIYLNDIDFTFNPSIYAEYEKSDNTEILEKQQRILEKGKSLLLFLTKRDFPIDIYTGDIIDKTYRLEYKDYEYIYLRGKYGYAELFKYVDNELFIKLKTNKEKDIALTEIQERKDVCNALQGGIV